MGYPTGLCFDECLDNGLIPDGFLALFAKAVGLPIACSIAIMPPRESDFKMTLAALRMIP